MLFQMATLTAAEHEETTLDYRCLWIDPTRSVGAIFLFAKLQKKRYEIIFREDSDLHSSSSFALGVFVQQLRNDAVNDVGSGDEALPVYLRLS